MTKFCIIIRLHKRSASARGGIRSPRNAKLRRTEPLVLSVCGGRPQRVAFLSSVLANIANFNDLVQQ